MFFEIVMFENPFYRRNSKRIPSSNIKMEGGRMFDGAAKADGAPFLVAAASG
jgi:hypothetical protein